MIFPEKGELVVAPPLRRYNRHAETGMLNIAGVILILIQFGLDGFAIVRGKVSFADAMDVIGWFLFGLIGIALLLIQQAWMNHKVSKLQRKVREEDED